MGLFNYDVAISAFQNNQTMLNVIEGYRSLDKYHLLRDNTTGKMCDQAEDLPETAATYKKWLSVCDGGLLFSTTLLSSTSLDSNLHLNFETIDEVNNPIRVDQYQLPDGYFIIALFNYGDLVCLSRLNQKVYLWDVEGHFFSTVWESFEDYLADEYNTALDMIEDNVLESVPLKEGEEPDGK